MTNAKAVNGNGGAIYAGLSTASSVVASIQFSNCQNVMNNSESIGVNLSDEDLGNGGFFYIKNSLLQLET